MPNVSLSIIILWSCCPTRLFSHQLSVLVPFQRLIVLARLHFGKHNSGLAQHNFGQGNFGLSGVVTQWTNRCQYASIPLVFPEALLIKPIYRVVSLVWLRACPCLLKTHALTETIMKKNLLGVVLSYCLSNTFSFFRGIGASTYRE